MGYSFYLISKEKEITQEDFDKAFSNMSLFNKKGHFGVPLCDVDFEPDFIRVSGAYGISGQYAEGFVLNLLMCLLDLNYKIKVLSKDCNYGSEEDWRWLNNIKINKTVYE